MLFFHISVMPVTSAVTVKGISSKIRMKKKKKKKIPLLRLIKPF